MFVSLLSRGELRESRSKIKGDCVDEKAVAKSYNSHRSGGEVGSRKSWKGRVARDVLV